MSDEDKQVARKILEERFGMPLEKLPVHQQPSAYTEMREIACKARLATAEAALDEALKREEEFAGYHNELVSDQAEKVEALSEQVAHQAATIRQLETVVRLFRDRIEAYGEWNDGCFYYTNCSASELQEPLQRANVLLAPKPFSRNRRAALASIPKGPK